MLVIALLSSIINDQIAEDEAMRLHACNLAWKLEDLSDIAEGRYTIVYATAAEIVRDSYRQ